MKADRAPIHRTRNADLAIGDLARRAGVLMGYTAQRNRFMARLRRHVRSLW